MIGVLEMLELLELLELLNVWLDGTVDVEEVEWTVVVGGAIEFDVESGGVEEAV